MRPIGHNYLGYCFFSTNKKRVKQVEDKMLKMHRVLLRYKNTDNFDFYMYRFIPSIQVILI